MSALVYVSILVYVVMADTFSISLECFVSAVHDIAWGRGVGQAVWLFVVSTVGYMMNTTELRRIHNTELV